MIPVQIWHLQRTQKTFLWFVAFGSQQQKWRTWRWEKKHNIKNLEMNLVNIQVHFEYAVLTPFFLKPSNGFFTMFQDIFVCGVQTIAEIVINHRRSCQADFPHFLRQRRNGAFFEDRREGASWDRKMGPWRGRTLLEDRSTFGRVYTMSVAS